jgi:hypothetical protein
MIVYKRLLEDAGISRLTPENIHKVRENLLGYSVTQLSRESGVSRTVVFTVLRLLSEDPLYSQKLILHEMYKREKGLILRKIGKDVNVPSYRYRVPLHILEEMGVLSRCGSGWKFEINRETMKKYWPDIDSW